MQGEGWVSHLTHRGEEVGVDHVLVREGWGRGEGGRVRVEEAFVSPKGLRRDNWPSEGEFDVSDHRPVSAVIECVRGGGQGRGEEGEERGRDKRREGKACVVI